MEFKQIMEILKVNVFSFLNQLIHPPRKATTPLRHNGLQGRKENEKTLEGTGKPILGSNCSFMHV